MNRNKIFVIAYIIFLLCPIAVQGQAERLNRELENAVIENSPELVESALKAGANPNYCLRYPSAFRRALRDKDIKIDIVKLLIDFKGNVNACNDYRQMHPILWDTVSINRPDLAELLVANGADVNCVFGTESMLCVCLEESDINFFKLILDSKANVDLIYAVSQNFKVSILDWALSSFLICRAIIEKNRDVIKRELLRFNPNIADVDRGVAKALASKELIDDQGNLIKKIALLIAYGAPLTQKEYDHEILKPMVAPYVDAVKANTPLFNPMVRLVVEYIYNIKVNLES